MLQNHSRKTEVVLTVNDVIGLYEKWGYLVLDDGEKIPTKTGYLRHLIDLCECQFNAKPELNGLKIKVLSMDNALAVAVLFNGVWIRSRPK